LAHILVIEVERGAEETGDGREGEEEKCAVLKNPFKIHGPEVK